MTISDSVSLLFCPAESPASHHIAFHLDQATFVGVVSRLTQGGIAFGNDPDDPTNGQTDDFLGGFGRVYFLDPNGHFFEVTA